MQNISRYSLSASTRVSTIGPQPLRATYNNAAVQGVREKMSPVELRDPKTIAVADGDLCSAPKSVASEKSYVVPRIPDERFGAIAADAAVLQIWEGTVVSVDDEEKQITARLRARRCEAPDHVGQIGFEWISDQDRELVSVGAVFYLTMFKKRKRGGTIENSQELRFRRLPSWTRSQLEAIDRLAAEILLKAKTKPLAK